ncbi:MAG: SUMF1/EgtB/PvdO family nonheme iron enzyme [Anaerolineales bacterium]
MLRSQKVNLKWEAEFSNDLARKDEYPQRRYYIPYNYWITRFPISNDQFSEYEVTTGHTDSLPKDWKRRLGQPVVNVSWHEVVEYTKWLNIIFKKEIPDGLVFRLPTEAEWERASRGEDGAEFPWGNANLDEFLNGGSPELMARLMRKIELDEGKSSNNFAEFNASFSRKNSSGIENDSEKAALDWMKMKLAELRTSMELADVGIFSPVTDSTHDIADMMGAVWEWTQSLYKLYPYETNDGRENLEASGERVIRGYFSPNNERFTVRSAKRVCAPPDVKGKYLDFRIVIAPPVS